MTLVSGITSLNLLSVHSAYAELRDVGASRRTALFSDQRFSPSLWSTLVHRSLLRLWDDYHAFLLRGAPATPEEVIPGLFRSTSSPPVAAATPRPHLFSAYVSRAKAQCQNLVIECFPSWCQEAAAELDTWWSRDRIDKVAEIRLPNRDLDALIVEGGPLKKYCTPDCLRGLSYSACWFCLCLVNRGPLWGGPTGCSTHPRSFLVVFNRPRGISSRSDQALRTPHA